MDRTCCRVASGEPDVRRAGLGDWREAIEQVQANAPQFLRRNNWNRRSNDSKPKSRAAAEK